MSPAQPSKRKLDEVEEQASAKRVKPSEAAEETKTPATAEDQAPSSSSGIPSATDIAAAAEKARAVAASLGAKSADAAIPANAPAPQSSAGPQYAMPADMQPVGTHMQLRLLQDSREVGGLIGRGGATINMLRSQSGAKVDITKAVPGVSERIVTVTGDVSNVLMAITLIAGQLQVVHNKDQVDPTAPLRDIEMTVLLPQPLVGAIIGKGGTTVKAIRDVTGATIKVATLTRRVCHSTMT